MILGEKIEWKVYVNQQNLYQIYNYWLNIDFFCLFFMNY